MSVNYWKFSGVSGSSFPVQTVIGWENEELMYIPFGNVVMSDLNWNWNGTTVLSCLRCGAPISIEQLYKETIECMYCGTNFVKARYE